ncbi:MAG: L-threonylcarbamoyladenylate synthase [Bacteroidota bacterium]
MDSSAVSQCLNEGGVVVVPTDTVYGLAASPRFPAAVQKIYDLKQRPARQHLPIMVADPLDLEQLGVDLNETANRLLASDWMPGPMTLVLGFDAEKVRPDWLADRSEIAVRIPDHHALREVLRATGPLLVTSANASGQATSAVVDEILPQLHGQPDHVTDGGRIHTVPSTLVNCRISPAEIIREAEVSAAAVLAYLEG